MNTQEIFDGLKTSVAWLIVALLIGLPLAGSLYVVVTPRQKLLVAWQNYRMRHTKRVLKDQHFKRAPRIIKMAKVLGLLVLIASTWTLLWALHVVTWWPPEDWWKLVDKYFIQ
jgi:hypothetical protein